MMSSNWIVPGKVVWLKHTNTFKTAVITERNENQKKAKAKMNNTGQIIQITFDKIFDFSNTNSQYYDMCNMDVLNEPEILNNLKKRYQKDQIFTKIGPTLIVINPYKQIKNLFNKNVLHDLVNRVKNYQRIDNIQPHVYMIAGTAYNKLRLEGKKQAIVISGESGAGKTQNAKYSMKFLAALSNQKNIQQHTQISIQDKIIDCNPVLQAFGNSKTVRNSNSSRFGKYVKIFLGNNFKLIGAKIQSYLLQKSRVTSASKKQRNFHVFYCLVSSEVRTQYGLKKNQKYEFLELTQCMQAEGINDLQNFKEVNQALDAIGFEKQQIIKIWGIVAAILMLGNIKFNQSDNQCKFEDNELIERIAKNLKKSFADLQKILLKQKFIVGKETTIKILSKQQCISNRNILAKALYNRMFDYLIERMNKSLNLSTQTSSIGLLDIFGFEKFEMNSFEQLCINFTNQKLQKLYTKYVFETQIQEIKKDGLGDKVKDILPPDNKAVIELIQKRKIGLSIFGIIDEKTSLGAANDENIIADLKKINHNNLIVDPSSANKSLFTINHTQSTVTYNVKDFKFKNQDSITLEINQIIENIFVLNEASLFKGKTLSTKFDDQIKSLMKQLEESQVHFIRCIKPNEKKSPDLIDQEYTIQQIKYLGVLETIKIRKSTFPFRKQFKNFNETYIDLISSDKSHKKLKPHELSLLILRKLWPEIQKDKNSCLVGNQRIYLSNQYQIKINDLILLKYKKKQQKATKIQKQIKLYLYRKNLLYHLKKLVFRTRKFKQIFLKNLLKIKKKKFKTLKQQVKKATIVFKQKKMIQEKKKLQEQKKRQEQKKKKAIQQEKIRKNKKQLEVEQMKIFKSQKFQTTFNKRIVPIVKKYLKFYYFSKIKFFSRQDLDATIINDEYDDKYETKSPSPKKVIKKQQNQFNQSFIAEKSFIQISNEVSALKGQLKVGKFVWHQGVNKLRDIIDQVYQSDISNQDQFYSPSSKDCNFDLKNIKPQILQKIKNTNSYQFFDEVLRKRTNLFGMKKLSNETLIAKNAPITKSLIKLPEDEQKKAIQSFKILLKLSQENKIEKVFKYIQEIIELLQNSSQQLKNQIFCHFIKQHKNNNQLSVIRIYQVMTIYLHIFAPQQNFLYAALNIFYQKLTASENQKKKENQYLQYLFPRLLYHIEKGDSAQNAVSYMPAQYQLMALMCKRQISLPIFFSVGNSVIIRVESNQTFDDIKQVVLNDVQINSKRLIKEFFGFFQIMNFQNQQLQESPIDDSRNVWDLLTYWERAKQKFQQGNIKPPVFILMLKIKFAYQCQSNDQQSIELFYAQCYFDLFIGRIRLQKQQIINASAILKLMNSQKKQLDTVTLIPMWALQQYGQNDLLPKIQIKYKRLNEQKYFPHQLKFLFIKSCDSSKICMSMAVPTQQPIKMYMRPKKVILAEKSLVHEEIPIKKILKWSVDQQSLMLCVQKQKSQANKTIVIRTQHATIVSKYLSQSAKLIMSNATRRNA